MRRHPKAPAVGSTQRQATGLGRIGIALAALLALLAFCGIGASTASAGTTRLPDSFSPLNGSGSGLTIKSPGGIAVDEATGNVFLSDSTPSVTDVLGATGGAPTDLVSPFQLTGFCFPSLNGTAFDNSPTSPNKGTLYVVDCAGKIKKFTRNPLTEKYEPAGELTATSAALFGALSGAALDLQGNLFAVDPFGGPSGGVVVKFNPAGTQVAQYNVGKAVGPARDVAIDAAGNLFVGGESGAAKYPVGGLGEADPPFVQISGSAGTWGLAADPARNKLYIAFGNRVAQYNSATLVKDFEFGAGTIGEGLRLTVNSATDRIYVADKGLSKKNVAVFGPPVPIPDVTTKAASAVAGATATLNGVVNPQAVAIIECKFEYGSTTAYGQTKPCEGGSIPTDSADHAVSGAIGGLVPNGATYHYRLVVQSANGAVKGADRTLVTAATVSTQPATAIGATAATLNGIVRPEGAPLTGCVFEYGTALDYGQSVPCIPAAASIPDDFADHAVSATPSLQPNTTYHFRLAATNAAGTVRGEDSTFTTVGPPQILEQRPFDATRDAVTLQASIDPSGSPTAYHFEFGDDTSYGTRIPADHDLFAGLGTEPITVSARRAGLSEKSVYYFRVVATSSRGTTAGPAQRLETLNQHDLPNDRALELVTPADKGNSGAVGSFDFAEQMAPQASEDGSSFLYPIQTGLPDSTAGGWTRWRSDRTASGWLAAQVSAPSLIAPPRTAGEGFALPSQVLYASPDLGCALLQSFNPLTADTPQLGVELGVQNLYRRDADGSFDLISNQLPLNPATQASGGSFYRQMETSDDCSRIYFGSPAYSFIAGGSGLYEWDEGVLRDAGVLPNGAPGAGAVVGGQVNLEVTSRWNVVSPDGRRFFFTAVRNQAPGLGKQGVFMRKDDPSCAPSPAPCTVDVSRSETAVPTQGARFETASEDGGRVFFLANRGIDAQAAAGGPTNGACGPTETQTGSGLQLEQKPCDLYAYDVESGDLADLSADANPADPLGAAVQGAIAVDKDGSHVYFAALGQLLPGKGNTYAQNIAGQGSANIYLAHSGALDYVTTLSRADLLAVSSSNGGAALMRRSPQWTAQTSANGASLLFESSLSLTGYDSGGAKELYLYSAGGGLSCLSCRPDGQPSLQPHSLSLLKLGDPRFTHRPRLMSEDGSRVFFSSFDLLAPGAVPAELGVQCKSGKRNVYQWQEGQVTLLATVEASGGCGLGSYLGASADGASAFIATKAPLLPQDKDVAADVYAVRAGGGFPLISEPPQCQVDESVQLQPNQIYCQGAVAPQPPASAPASAGFHGSGNPPAAGPRSGACPKGKVRRHGKCVKKRVGKKKHERSHRRAAKTNRGGVK